MLVLLLFSVTQISLSSFVMPSSLNHAALDKLYEKEDKGHCHI